MLCGELRADGLANPFDIRAAGQVEGGDDEVPRRYEAAVPKVDSGLVKVVPEGSMGSTGVAGKLCMLDSALDDEQFARVRRNISAGVTTTTAPERTQAISTPMAT